MFDKLNSIHGIARPIQHVLRSKTKLILQKWQPGSSMSITVMDLEKETPHGQLLKEFEFGEIVTSTYCHNNTLITDDYDKIFGLKNKNISSRQKFPIWNLNTMQQFANIDFLDQIEGYDEGDIEAEFNCLVMSDEKLAMSFDMFDWDDDKEEYNKGRITFFWNLDTTNPKIENLDFDTCIKFPDGAPGSYILWKMLMNDKFFCNLIKDGQFHVYDMGNLSSAPIGKIEFSKDEAQGTFKLLGDQSPTLVMFADNILKIFNIENCECTLQVDFTSHPDILNRGNLELLFVDNMTCIPFFLQRQRDPSTQDEESRLRGIKQNEEYQLVYVTLEGAIVDALKMNFNIGDYDDGNDQYDESERWVDEQRRFHANQANGAVFIISTYNVFKHEQ